MAHEASSTTPSELFGAAIDLAANLDDISAVLHGLVASATELTDAKYAALTVLDGRGEIISFIHHGVSEDVAQRIPQPTGAGLLLLIPPQGHLIVDDVSTHPAFEGWPEHHPKMHNLLGVPIRIDDRVFGRLYVADKDGGFTNTDARTLEQFAAAAAVAVDNARRYTLSRDRECWMAVSQRITAALLAGTEEEEVLELIAAEVREVARADLALLVLPSVGGSWACEIADGVGASDVLGVQFPPEGRAMRVLAAGSGMIVDSMSRASSLRVPQLARYGPALYAPMVVQGTGTGVLILLRLQGRPEFVPEELSIAEAVAAQAALALELASARHAQDFAALVEERQRISRDLHDLAIQRLFATGMQLESVQMVAAQRPETEWLIPRVAQALQGVDDSVAQIRAIVHSLRGPRDDLGLVGRLEREVSLARTGLGFAPSLTISRDGVVLESAQGDVASDIIADLEGRVAADMCDDVVAVVREGLANAARHAQATSVLVHVDVSGFGASGTVTVEVIDDGRGIGGSSRRSGLDNLDQRARLHGGSFTSAVSQRGGTALRWRVPLA